MKKNNFISTILCSLLYIATFFSVIVMIFIIAHIFIKGLPDIDKNLFALEYTSENVSVIPALLNTLCITLLTLLITVPSGIFAAIYLTEYANSNNKFVKFIRITTQTLTGIPSIIYGLFGMLFFVTFLKWGYSLISGTLTLCIIILPVIIRTTEEALFAVPDVYREASFGLGAGKLRTIFKVILPCAVPGILSGVILSTGRIIGETAALIYTAGTVANIPSYIFASGRTLSVHMYILSSEGLHINKAYSTAVILLVIVFGINALSSLLAKKVTFTK